mmetsp:Transcript_47631/g.34897  ORF Transcript_47631/g.34897 Transcript_47631/m.34897 type:complete len:84 (-) Transcript_47631:533-784(-)
MHLVIDREMASIVLVKKAVMDAWRKRQETLRAEMEEENSKVESNLQKEKQLYQNKIKDMEKKQTEKLNDLNKKYEDLKAQESE